MTESLNASKGRPADHLILRFLPRTRPGQAAYEVGYSMYRVSSCAAKVSSYSGRRYPE